MSNGNHPNMREFSMFFHATLSILGVIALLMMNMIIDKMDTYAAEQQKLTLTLTGYMISTDKDIETLSIGQKRIETMQRIQHPTIDRARRYFNGLDKRTE